MKLRRWSLTISWITSFTLAGCIALLFFDAGWLALAESWGEVFSGGPVTIETWHALVPIAVLFLLALVSAVSLFLGWLFQRKVMHPLRRAISFIDALSRGETIPPLPLDENVSEDIETLLKALNVLRDRQQSLVTKAHQNVAHQLKMNRDRDRFEDLKRSAFGDILSEARRTLGILKGQLLVQQNEFERRNAPGEEFYRDLLGKTIRRQSALGREIEQIFDINRLDWKRWNTPASGRFDTGDFIRELLENARIFARSREIALVAQISPDVPGRLFADRELLMQLLGMLTRTACRTAMPKSDVSFGCVRDDRNEAVFELRFLPRSVSPEAIAENSGAAETMPLNLEIVRNTANLIGCEVQIAADGRYAVFRLSLPVGSSLFGATGFSVLPAVPAFPDGRAGKKETDPVKVLLLDDDDDGSEVLQLIMRKYGVIFTVVRTEKEMELALRGKNFDALAVTSPFADRAPGALLERIFAIRRLPVLLLSPVFPEAVRRQLEMHENVFWVTMPLNYALLHEVIRRSIRK